MPPTLRSHSKLKRPYDQLERNSVNTNPKQKKKIFRSNVENDDVGEIENRDNLQELIVTYMNPALAMIVCRKWCSMAEEKHEKIMQCEVEKIVIACQNQYWRRCDIRTYGKNNYSRRLENVKPTDVFNIIRFLHTTDIKVSGYRNGELNDLNKRMSSNWRKDIKKLSLKTGATEDSCLEFVQGFSNLTDLDVTRSYWYYGIPLALPYVKNMKSIKRLRLVNSQYNTTQEGDFTLELIRNKSDRINKMEITSFFSMEAMINFMKTCSFSKDVQLKFLLREQDEDELLDFVRECNGVVTEVSVEVTRVEFVYGGTSFTVRY